MNNLDMLISRALYGGSGRTQVVTPASIVAATGQMTDDQVNQALVNLRAASLETAAQIAEDLSTVYVTNMDVAGSTAVIEPKPQWAYHCGELTSLTISNPPAVGAYSIVFYSGTVATTTTIPSSILGLERFTAKANTLYEINVLDGRAVVGSWVVTGS